jgi:hypothetical protein
MHALAPLLRRDCRNYHPLPPATEQAIFRFFDFSLLFQRLIGGFRACSYKNYNYNDQGRPIGPLRFLYFRIILKTYFFSKGLYMSSSSSEKKK